MWNEKSCRVHGKWQDQKYNGTSELSRRVNGAARIRPKLPNENFCHAEK